MYLWGWVYSILWMYQWERCRPAPHDCGEFLSQYAYQSVIATHLISDSPGVLFWKVNVKVIIVYVNGEPKKIELGRSAVVGQTGSRPFPTAVLDSDVPLILANEENCKCNLWCN